MFPDTDDVDEIAARWWLAVQSARPYDAVALQAWLDADPSHREAFEHMRSTWNEFDAHKTTPEMLEARRAALSWAQQQGRQRWGNGVSRRTLFSGMGAAAAVAAVAVGAPLLLHSRPAYSQSVTTRIGEQRVLSLPDGSRLTMDANSALEISFDADLRKIDLLHGRAHFEVAKDVSRPFKVSANRNVVTATGTAFTVEWREKRVSVALQEGHLVVVPIVNGHAASEVDLLPQQCLIIDTDGLAPPALSHVDSSRDLDWREGKIFFDDEPLDLAAARMNDYSDTKIVVSSQVTGVRVSGMFSAGQSDQFAEALQSYYPVRIDHGDKTIMVRPRI